MKNVKPPNRNLLKQTLISRFLPFIPPIMRWLERSEIRRRQLRQLPWGVLSILIVVAVISTVWSVLRTGDIPGLALNFGTEMAGAIVTYLLLEIVIGTRQKKELLLAQLSSKSIDVATNAIEEIVRNEWHRDGSLNNISLYKANLPGVELNLASFENSDLVEANFQGARLYSVNMKWAILQRANLTNADLSFSNLSDADLTNIVLAGANLFHTIFVRAHMEVADLKDADLRDADLEGADLFGADLRGANLKNANLKQTLLKTARYNSKTIFPNEFNPTEAEMIEVEKPENLIAFV